ncbi:MAG: hypothetical protein IJN43_07685 [Ruminococcus sp.]|nr:hypothetical protein [Ruminococcus sp.]
MKRKIFSLFICSMVLSGVVSSCNTDEVTVTTSQSSSTIEETTEAATFQVAETENRTINPPEEGGQLTNYIKDCMR